MNIFSHKIARPLRHLLRLLFIFVISYFLGSGLFAQEKKLAGVNIDLFRASYEKLSEEAFSKLWDESLSQQLKITLLDRVLKIKMVVGSSVVSFGELRRIPELETMMQEGTFPSDRIFIKHVCQVEFGVTTNTVTLLEAGVSLPYRVTYIESLPLSDTRDPISVKRKNLLFFKEYFEMMMNRLDKSVLALENSFLPKSLVLRVGEQFSMERFLLVSAGVGVEGPEISANNPVLLIRGHAKFIPLRFSKTLFHSRVTIQHYGSDENFRVTLSHKNINTLEIFNTDFGFDIKMRKKLFKLLRLSVNLNLVRFAPTWNFYHYNYKQFLSNIETVGDFNSVKKNLYMPPKKAAENLNQEMDFFREYHIKGRSFFNNLNLFNIYENDHQEKIERHTIMNKEENPKSLEVGVFLRYQAVLMNEKKMRLKITNDLNVDEVNKPEQKNYNGVIFRMSSEDVHGFTESKKWYFSYLRKLLNELSPQSDADLDFILESESKDRFRRLLRIEINDKSYQTLFQDRQRLTKDVLALYQKIFQPSAKDSDFIQWRKGYIKAMLLRTIDRMYKMKMRLDEQHYGVQKKRKYFRTPGQLPMQEIVYLVLFMSLNKEDTYITYDFFKQTNQDSVVEDRYTQMSYRFIYEGKSFVREQDALEFYY